MKGKVKIGLNMLLMIIVLGVIFYVMDNSLSDIFAQLMETSWLVLIAVIFFVIRLMSLPSYYLLLTHHQQK